MGTVEASWEEYSFGGEVDTALVVRWSEHPYWVAFWRNYVPIWFLPEGPGFYFGWVEAAPYECLCDDDREHMSLAVVEKTPRRLLVRWTMDLVTFGGRIYRGNTRVVETYEFLSNGLCIREVVLFHGTETDPKRNKNGYEICEFGVVNPPGTSPLDNVGIGGVVDRVVDPWSGQRVEIRWSENEDGSISASGWNEDVGQWRGQVHLLQSKTEYKPFVAFGRDSMQKGYYPTKHLVWGLNFEDKVLTFFHWPAKMDKYYEYLAETRAIRDLSRPTHTPIISYQFRKKCEEIESPLTFKWLIGITSDPPEDVVEKSREWLVRQGEMSQ